VARILECRIPLPSALRADVPPALDAMVARGLARSADDRPPTAREMAAALEAAFEPARPARVSEWLERIAGEALNGRAARVAEIEQAPLEPAADGAVDLVGARAPRPGPR